MINNLVDKVYLINTKDATERLEDVSNQLNKLGISFERVEAVSVDGLSHKRDMPSFFRDKNDDEFEGWNVQAKSLQETTKNILKKSIESGYEKILILEDDAQFYFEHYDNGCKLISDFMEKNNNWDFLNLNYRGVSRYSFTPYNGILHMIIGCLCCQAYIIHKNVMQEYLIELERINFTIDNIAMYLHIKRRRSFCINPKMVNHPKFKYSTIRGKEVHY